MNKSKIKKILFYLFVFLLLICIFFLIDFLYRTLYYKNHLKLCSNSDKLCGLQIINLHFPDKYINILFKLSKEKGLRVEIPKKHQKNISSSTIIEHLPEIEQQYQSYTTLLSKYIGEPVKVLPNDIKNRITLVVYEKEGDYIDWHFDTNHYTGRFFTLLIPITLEPTCSSYQYRNHKEKDLVVEIGKDQGILFEGDKVYHRGKMLSKDQYRVILSLTYVTDTNMNAWNYLMHKMKEFGIYGTM